VLYVRDNYVRRRHDFRAHGDQSVLPPDDGNSSARIFQYSVGMS